MLTLAAMWMNAGAAQAGEPDAACPVDYPAGVPTVIGLPFKWFVGRGGVDSPILLDVYVPGPTFEGELRPAVVLVHGGGFHQGCKSLLNKEAVDLQGRGFIVFSVDYRLSCTAAEHPEPEEEPLCGWPYPKRDPVTGTRGAAVHDIQDAVAWVRANASTYFGFNGRVATVGGSAGGTLVLQAAASLSPDDPRRPDAVGTWSAFTEFTVASDGSWACDMALGSNQAVSSCWSAVVQYMGCDIRVTPELWCAQRYAAATAVSQYLTIAPPVFIANSDAEVVYVLEALDLDAALTSLGVAHSTCIIENSSLHGRAYVLTRPCAGGTSGTVVMDDMVTFLSPLLGL